MEPILVTGARGRIGQVACRELTRLGVGFLATDTRGLEDLFDIHDWNGPILHLAVDWTDPLRTLQMTDHLVRQCRGRFILASSITVAPESGFERHGYLTAAKLASEAWARAWAHQTGGMAIALRLGHFGTPVGQAPSRLEEAVRVTEGAIRHWLHDALHDGRAGELTIWNAIGYVTGET